MAVCGAGLGGSFQAPARHRSVVPSCLLSSAWQFLSHELSGEVNSASLTQETQCTESVIARTLTISPDCQKKIHAEEESDSDKSCLKTSRKEPSSTDNHITLLHQARKKPLLLYGAAQVLPQTVLVGEAAQ